MPSLNNLFSMEDYYKALDDGYISVKRHPTELLWIANYTAKAQFDKAWNDVTKQCRGLIFNFHNEIVARPFPKFFNLGEVPEATLPDGQIRVMEKMDGSLGILYQERTHRHQPKYAIATRGSFESDQAKHATALLRAKYPAFEPVPGFTYLFEIIYPENRIVVDYGHSDNLYLLDIIDNETGRSALHYGAVRGAWTGMSAWTYDYHSIADVLAAEPKNNAEGFVVHFAKTEQRVKVKFEQYVALHRIMTNTSARTLWEFLAVNECKDIITDPKHWGSFLGMDPVRAERALSVGPQWLDTVLKDVPDEFYAWVRKTIDEINQTAGNLIEDAIQSAIDAKQIVGDDKRALFEAIQDHPMQREMIRFLNGNGNYLFMRGWREAMPAATKPFWSQDEAVA